MLSGVKAVRVSTQRLTARTLQVDGRNDGEPVVFIHGNVSSSVFWQQTLMNMPSRYRPVAVDLRGFGGTDSLPVDAARGVRDFADDVAGVVDVMNLGKIHLVGWSLGGGVVLQMLRDLPEVITSVTVVNPVSPFGFGGTHGPGGQLNDPSGAGSGGGTANPEFVARLADGDRGDDRPTAPRQVLLAAYVKPPFVPEHADEFVDSMVSTTVGDDNYPGDQVRTEAWPGIAPGNRGVLNAIAPTNFRLDDLHEIETKPPIQWIRGSDDQIVSDTSIFDLAYLGSVGAVPGWPGYDVAPPQPMVTQTKAVLDRYADGGGAVTDIVVDGAGHSPHIEKPKEFLEALLPGFNSSRR